MAERAFVSGRNAAAAFGLRLHRGEGMVLLAMDWRRQRPPRDFVGFAIEVKAPGAADFVALKNRLSFSLDARHLPDDRDTRQNPSILAPFQAFRWMHMPQENARQGEYRYRVTPLFMDAAGALRTGAAQEAATTLMHETVPGVLNIAFTRGYVSSQAFTDRFGGPAAIPTLLPRRAAEGLDFVATAPQAEEALAWMGYEARAAILKLLDEAIADSSAKVDVIAYDLNLPPLMDRFAALAGRLRIIIDDSGDHGEAHSAETEAAKRLVAMLGPANVIRQDVKGLQHNKMIIVRAATWAKAVGGSTNFSWRGFYVQSNNAVIVSGAAPVAIFAAAFEAYWAGRWPFASPGWQALGLAGVDAQVTFSPRDGGAVLAALAEDVAATKSSLFYSLAFISITPGAVQDALAAVTDKADRYVYGMSDKRLGLNLQRPGGNPVPVDSGGLGMTLPPPFRPEATGGGGVRLHHKFIVIDFDLPTARVYTGSYNVSRSADGKNGENFFCIRDRRVATAYMIEALRIFDHYHFRTKRAANRDSNTPMLLQKPPAAGEKAWFDRFWDDPVKVKDRTLFAGTGAASV
ncbi:phospholipase D-like domain-containing protein [Sandaracinobacteroides saxicola]|uniref:Phospholipase D n=1 Tax=Sandaracinobacteroides saxicola TaxID=2759707 RepID=A0A7G5IJ74_9SPHN|nr:phospholipase D-like domain-containing protein [Sandaracinobacteroides saxicola]QMW23416.1 phospholipase [Sandaracinobacteroides saxicola]